MGLPIWGNCYKFVGQTALTDESIVPAASTHIYRRQHIPFQALADCDFAPPLMGEMHIFRNILDSSVFALPVHRTQRHNDARLDLKDHVQDRFGMDGFPSIYGPVAYCS